MFLNQIYEGFESNPFLPPLPSARNFVHPGGYAHSVFHQDYQNRSFVQIHFSGDSAKYSTSLGIGKALDLKVQIFSQEL